MNPHKRQLLRHLAAGTAVFSLSWRAFADEATHAATAWARSTQRLASSLLQLNTENNAVISPLSIWSALAMTHAGAQGRTAEEIASVLHMPSNAHAFAQNWQAIRHLQERINTSPVKLHTANRIWLDAGYKVQPSYVQHLERDYQASPALVDFQHLPDASRVQINQWVSQQTRGLIPQLFQANSMDSMTRLVLTQAMYLNAPWARAFDTNLTEKSNFTLATGRQVAVPMMKQHGQEVMAAEVSDAKAHVQIVELPYQQDDLRMVLFVPRTARDLPQAIAWLNRDWASQLKPQTVRLTLPRWKARQSQSLNQSLQRLGMRQAFDPGRANFYGIHAQSDLYVSAVQHEACVEITEEGTEAAAATGVIMFTRAALPVSPPLEIRADRPFVWAVVDSKNRGVLFAGVVQDPRANN